MARMRSPEGELFEVPDGQSVRAAEARGWTPERVLSPGQVAGPAANTRRFMRAIPYVTGAAGSLLPPPFGGMAGATGGGLLGRAAELQLAGEMPRDAASIVRQIAPAGIEQAALQAPASALSAASGPLIGLRGIARERAVAQALKEVNAPRAAARSVKTQELARRVPEATAARRAAAAATKAKIGATKGQISVRDLTDWIVANREARFNVKAPPKVRAAIEKDVRGRVAAVLPKFTGRVVGGRRDVFDLPTSQIGKQAFDDIVRNLHSGIEGGIKAKPSIDLDIADAWRGLLEQKVPGVRELNEATKAAIKTEQSLKRAQRAMPTEQAHQLRTQELDAATRERVLAQRSANPLQLFKGIPVRGGFARPGLSLRPGTFSEALGKIGEFGPTAAVQAPAAILPRLAAMLIALQQEQQPVFDDGTMPPDTLLNQPGGQR